MIRFETDIGRIGIGRPVFARITAEQVAKYQEKAILTDVKGRPVKVGITGHEALRYIEVIEYEDEDAVDLKLYLMVKFGTSIKALTKKIADDVRTEALNMTGIPIKKITIVITAVKSKRVARRNLEVEC